MATSGAPGPEGFFPGSSAPGLVKEGAAFSVLTLSVCKAPPPLLRLAATSGCSGPRAFSWSPAPAVKRLGFRVLALGLVSPARLLRLLATSGCSGPRLFPGSPAPARKGLASV